MKNSIYESAMGLVRKFKTRDPEKIARLLGIEVIYNPDFSHLKGFYIVMNRKRYIVVNDNLDERQKRIVLSHELGHDRLHRKLEGDAGLQEFVLYDMKSRPEYEANLFAAELLLDDSEMLSLARDGLDIEEISKILETDINLVAIKVSGMNARGYNFNSVIPPKRNFLAEKN